MAKATHCFASGIEIRFHQETTVVADMMGTSRPDQNWKHIDKNGHAHIWDGDKLPTLGEVVTGKTWVGDDYDGYEIDVTEFRCLVCGEVVNPKHTLSYEPHFVKGPSQYTLRIDPHIMGMEFPIPDDDVAPLIDILTRIFDGR